MTSLCEAWAWLLGEWSARWGVLIGAVAVWFLVRPPRQCETRHAVCMCLLLVGVCLPLLPSWGSGFWPALLGSALALRLGRRRTIKQRVKRLRHADRSLLTPPTSGWRIAVVALVFATVIASIGSLRFQATANEVQPDKAHVGQKIANFRLRDYLGTEHQLKELSDSRLVVVTFLGTECPLAKLYGSRLVGLAAKYEKKDATFIGINSNQQDTPSEIGHYARRHGIKFTLLKDPGNRVADQFRAERTPEVFVLDENRIVRYWGRIDDQFGVGYARPEPKRHFLSNALDELLAGKDVSKPEMESVGCHIGRVARKTPTGDITYSNQISRIIQRRCVECHREAGIAPFALETYNDVAGWAETMREVMQDQRMPPWHADPKYGHFANDTRMPEEEKQLFYRWVENGIPQGSPSDLPAKAEFVDGWALGKPDMVISMPEPITVSADGVVPYQYITIDPGFTEGKWVRASEVRPGVRSVVHHVVVFINPPGGDPILEERGFGFETVGVYVPGTPPMELEDGVARYVPAGSTFVFQMHYTPDGTEHKDQSKIGLYFADPATIRRTIQTGVVVNLDFVIPAHAENHAVDGTHRFSHDMELHALVPHMHYRGKSFRFEVTYPNGSREILLDVPRYDFNWQNTYRLAKPKFVPAGTLLKCTAHFDNSENNLSNPDPTIPVKWGEQTWDEMMIGYFEGVFLNQDLSLPQPKITPLANDDFRVRFTYQPDRPVKSVHLAGTFNEWNTSKHRFNGPDERGVYTRYLRLKPGEYRYKFVIDGNYWSHDPASKILTGFTHDSFFVVGNKAQRTRETTP